jgi:UDP-2,4-diacetamido-2,4,6-trideoxy-beta-L-altropyranose hydrolase
VNIVIRADASVYIGSGHVMRCLVLAKALVKQGYEVSFYTRPQAGDLINLIQKSGFEVNELSVPEYWKKPSHNADYEAWLQVPWQDDADSLIQQVNNVDLLIVDHYGLNESWEKYVKSRLSCKIFAIDDIVRKHDADLILDQTLLRNPQEYKEINPDSAVLAGCDFALIKPNFISYRNKLLNVVKLPSDVNLLVSMGGIDKPNATLLTLETLSKIGFEKPFVTVLLGPNAPNYPSVKNFSLKNPSWIKHIDFVEDMAELISTHHFGIGAPGGTSWERACLGVPSIVIPLADNQQTICAQLIQIGAAIKVEIDDISSSLLSAYRSMVVNWSSMRSANFSLCDGLGLLRVTQCVNSLCSNAANSITLRRSTKSDIKLIFDWQVLPETRKYSLTPNVPTWKNHKKWMNKKLQAQCDYLYIVQTLTNNNNIGVLRLDRLKKGKYLVSIFIDPQYFGQGIGKKILAYVDMLHPNITIQATVLEANVASQKLFTSAHYQQLAVDIFIRPPIHREANEVIYYN